jgi:2-keto-4-pentenoate hydratase/2-oxohepta-3-ene-1,7-dioic acid hydratase in catechol pathway
LFLSYGIQIKLSVNQHRYELLEAVRGSALDEYMGKAFGMKIGQVHMEIRSEPGMPPPIARSICIGSVYGEKAEEVNQNNQPDGRGQDKESGE